MREDMAKVIVERGRGGDGWEKHGRRLPWDDLPSHAGFRPRGRARTKFLNENLAPLRRYLATQVGRPWDRVYSEMRERMSPRNAVQMRIHQHLADFVHLHVVLVDGVPHAQRRGYGPFRPIETWRGLPLYVCPRTGLLRAVRRRSGTSIG